MSALSACTYACMPEGAADPSIGDCEPLHACWESNPEPL